jgi:hypothetical protein
LPMLASDKHAKPSAERQMNFRGAVMALPCGHLSTLEGLYLTSGGVVAQSANVAVGSKGEILARSTCFPLCPQQRTSLI